MQINDNGIQMSTLCYLEQDGKYLMLHRVVKKNDVNKDKWIGVGGHFEQDESPEECLLREVREETGYTLTSYRFRGIVTFVSGDGVTEYMHLFTADGFCGEPLECDEGVLEWVPKDKIGELNIWEGDKIFFRLLTDEEPFFSLKLVYDGAGALVSAVLNGNPMTLPKTDPPQAAAIKAPEEPLADAQTPEEQPADVQDEEPGTPEEQPTDTQPTEEQPTYVLDEGLKTPEEQLADARDEGLNDAENQPADVQAEPDDDIDYTEAGGENEIEAESAQNTEPAEVQTQRAGKGKGIRAFALAAVVVAAAAAALFQYGKNTDLLSILSGGSGNEGSKSFYSGTPITLTKVEKDAGTAGDVLRSLDTEKYTTKELILVNPWHLLPEEYETELEQLEYGHRMDECAAENLREMLADCRADGNLPLICSSYRERSKQETLFENDVRRFMYRGYSEEEAREETAKNVAVPGSSEHEAGLAVDIVYLYYQSLDESQENNATQQWLMEHCMEYGFILRYPRDKQDITGITYEPWHYRYVGREAAEEIMSQGICLEEYLGVIDSDESFEILDSDEW